MIKGHGNNIYSFGGKIRIDFSSNIAYNNKSDLLIEHLKNRLDLIKNYPDPEALELREALKKHHLNRADLGTVSIDEILVVNGSAEAFYLVANFLSGKTCIFTPSFAEYEDSCTLYEHNIQYRSFGEFSSTESFSEFDSVWLGIPNNPNSYIVDIATVLKKCKLSPNCYFVVDLAYSSLCSQVMKSLALIEERPSNLILINSLTKSFGIPGIRLGYIVAHSDIIDRLSNMRPPWSVNALSLELGKYVLGNYESFMPNIAELLKESLFLQNEISSISGLKITPSKTNFFLCEITDHSLGNVCMLQDFLVEKYGILIRNCSNFRGLSGYHFRIAAQNHSENMELIKALREWTV